MDARYGSLRSKSCDGKAPAATEVLHDADTACERDRSRHGRVFNVNVRAAFQLPREAARRMTVAGYGRIVNIGSVFGEATPSPGLGLSCGSKFAVAGVTRAWSRDVGPAGITVNDVRPALIQPEPGPERGPAFDAMRRCSSVGRYGTAGEVAAAVAFLVRPDAGYLNGATLNVDGGWGA